MLPGKRDFYRCCKARRSASHVNKEFWQQFQNYAPPSLRVNKNKNCTYYIYIILYDNIYIRDSQLNRHESVSLASLARQLSLASERSERDTLRSVQLRIADIYIILYILEKWFPLWGERAHSLKLFCMYDKRFEISKTK